MFDQEAPPKANRRNSLPSAEGLTEGGYFMQGCFNNEGDRLR